MIRPDRNYRVRIGLALTLGLVRAANAQTIGRNGMVATHHPLASQAGLRILEQGGNAVDAAIASAAVLAVANPFMCGLGGVGGYALVYDARSGKTEALDFVGDAPRAATLDQFRGDRLWDFSKAATDGYLAPLVPGILAGWAALHDRYGTMSWAQILAPAIDYAENGFPVTSAVAAQISSADFGKVTRYPYGHSLFAKPDGAPLAGGDIWVQKDLAQTLKAVAAKGPSEFYKGSIARKIAGHLRDNGGLITVWDALEGHEISHWSHVKSREDAHDVVSRRPLATDLDVVVTNPMIWGLSSVAVSPDGKRLLSGGGDTYMRLWSLEGHQIYEYPHRTRVVRVAFTSDGRQALSGCWDGSAYLWELPQ